MAVNVAALALIKSAEGFVDHWYPDPAHGWKVPTVGYGHTDAAGAPFFKDTKGKRFTEAEASAILLHDLERYEQDVRDLVTVPLNENQHGALTSFDYNLGRGNLAKSTLLKKLNKGDYAGAAKEFGKWVNAAGKPLPGLVKRREAERLLFLKPVAGGSYAPPQPVPDPAQPKSPLAAIIAIIIGLAAAAYAYLKSHGLAP